MTRIARAEKKAEVRDEKISALEKEIEQKLNRMKLMKNEARTEKRRIENRKKYVNGGNLLLIDKKNADEALTFADDSSLLFGVLTNRQLLKHIAAQQDHLRQEGLKRMAEWGVK